MPSPPRLVVPPAAEVAAEAVEQWKRADSRLAAALDAGILPAKALSTYGLRLCREENAAEGARVFHAALAFSAGDPVLWNNLAVALDRMGAFAQAIACLEQSLALVRGQHDGWLLLGGIRKKTGDAAGAEAAFQVALELDGESFLAWQCMAILKQEMQEHAAAVECFLACIRCGGESAAIQANVGKLCYQMGRYREAAEAYAQAVRQDAGNTIYPLILRKTRFLLGLIEGRGVGGVEEVDGALGEFFAGCRTNETSAAEVCELLKETYSLLSGFGHFRAAAAVAKKWVELAPEQASARYLLQAVTANTHDSDGAAVSAQIERSPESYIIETFDQFADGFEQQLVNVLGYDAPEQLCAALKAVAEPGRLYKTLDAGCGTGLCAPFLRPLSRMLVGVDLSPKMLEQAGRRKAYDQLICEELVGFMQRTPGAFEIIVAADVLIYFGDLKEWFAAAARAMVAGGLLAVSTESLERGTFRLLASGRFAHTVQYIRTVAQPFFEECSCVSTTLRKEAAGRLAGDLFVFRRHSS